MNRGCISLGDMKCDQCKRNIPYPQRYLLIEEKGKKKRWCVDCTVKKGLAKQLKGDRGFTFLGGEDEK